MTRDVPRGTRSRCSTPCGASSPPGSSPGQRQRQPPHRDAGRRSLRRHGEPRAVPSLRHRRRARRRRRDRAGRRRRRPVERIARAHGGLPRAARCRRRDPHALGLRQRLRRRRPADPVRPRRAGRDCSAARSTSPSTARRPARSSPTTPSRRSASARRCCCGITACSASARDLEEAVAVVELVERVAKIRAAQRRSSAPRTSCRADDRRRGAAGLPDDEGLQGQVADDDAGTRVSAAPALREGQPAQRGRRLRLRPEELARLRLRRAGAAALASTARSCRSRRASFTVDGETLRFTEVSAERPMTLGLNKTVTISVDGRTLADGKHKIGIGFIVTGMGEMQFDVTDAIGAETATMPPADARCRRRSPPIDYVAALARHRRAAARADGGRVRRRRHRQRRLLGQAREDLPRRRCTSASTRIRSCCACVAPSRRDSTVLDVGAGTGRHTLALAPHVARVVAVDPSPAMLGLLREDRRRAGARRTSRPSRRAGSKRTWSRPTSCSARTSSTRSPMPCRSSASSRRRRRSASSSTCASIRCRRTWGSGASSTASPLQAQPVHIDLVNLLAQIGIVADVEVVEHRFTWTFADLDEAVAQVRNSLCLREDDAAATAKLRALLEARLVRVAERPPRPGGRLRALGDHLVAAERANVERVASSRRVWLAARSRAPRQPVEHRRRQHLPAGPSAPSGPTPRPRPTRASGIAAIIASATSRGSTVVLPPRTSSVGAAISRELRRQIRRIPERLTPSGRT